MSSISGEETVPETKFQWAEQQMERRKGDKVSGIPDVANKNGGCPVKFEFI